MPSTEQSLKIRYVSVSKLTNDPKNARVHNERNILAIAESLKRFGQRKNIVVAKDGTVIAGNGTLEAARRLGWKTIAVSDAPPKKSDQRAFALADNRTAELASWDQDVLRSEIVDLVEVDYTPEILESLGFGHSEVEGYIRTATIQESAVPELPKKPRTKLGDVYEMGDHRLVCGDSLQAATWKALLGDRRAQMVFTDPPYGVSYVGGFSHQMSPKERLAKGGSTIQNDALTPDELRKFLTTALTLVLEHAEPNASWYVCSPSGDLMLEFGHVLGREGLGVWRHNLIWSKDRFVMGRTDYHYRHESIFYGWKEGPHYFTDDRTQDSVLEYPRPQASEDHPTMKPVPLIAQCVRNSSKPGWLVVDPFGGSGSTLLACEQENRVAALIELDPRYCDVIVRRWEEATGRKAILQNGTKASSARSHASSRRPTGTGRRALSAMRVDSQ